MVFSDYVPAMSSAIQLSAGRSFIMFEREPLTWSFAGRQVRATEMEGGGVLFLLFAFSNSDPICQMMGVMRAEAIPEIAMELATYLTSGTAQLIFQKI